LQWEAVSESAKAMITAMLTLEETQRSTAAELLKVSISYDTAGNGKMISNCATSIRVCFRPGLPWTVPSLS